MTLKRFLWLSSLAASAFSLSCNGSINIGEPDADHEGDADETGCPSGCPSGQLCQDGQCVSRCSGSGVGDCPDQFECCDGTCVNVREDPHNCGGCGTECAPRGDGCVGRVCSCNRAMACTSPLVCCGDDGCVDPDTDARHCGGCDQPCGGACAAGACETCTPDPHETTGGNTCADAEPIGTVADSGDQQVLTGNLFPLDDEDCYWFTASDVADTDCDTFHVDIRFTQNPGDQFGIEVYRGSCAAPECATESFTSYSWFADFFDTTIGDPPPVGECPCRTPETADGANLCSDNSAAFRFCVIRVSGDAEACAWYEVEVSNGVRADE
jgi:hypothetical protein